MDRFEFAAAMRQLKLVVGSAFHPPGVKVGKTTRYVWNKRLFKQGFNGGVDLIEDDAHQFSLNISLGFPDGVFVMQRTKPDSIEQLFDKVKQIVVVHL